MHKPASYPSTICAAADAVSDIQKTGLNRHPGMVAYKRPFSFVLELVGMSFFTLKLLMMVIMKSSALTL